MARGPSLSLIEGGGRTRPTGGWLAAADAAGPLGFWLRNAEFASRRAHALAHYYTALAGAPGPEQAMAVHARFWNGLMEDYAAWTLESLAPFALGPAPPGPPVPSPPRTGGAPKPGSGRRTG